MRDELVINNLRQIDDDTDAYVCMRQLYCWINTAAVIFYTINNILNPFSFFIFLKDKSILERRSTFLLLLILLKIVTIEKLKENRTVRFTRSLIFINEEKKLFP